MHFSILDARISLFDIRFGALMLLRSDFYPSIEFDSFAFS